MVHLENCNCIKKADIKIQEGTLNIKYGTNGTGKSTISKAVSLKAQGDEEKLQSLRPYMANDSEKTIVNGLNFNKVMVFNEEYVNSYLFEDDSFLENSFKVFLKSDECEELSKNIANKVVSVLSFSKYFLNFDGTISDGTSSPTIPV